MGWQGAWQVLWALEQGADRLAADAWAQFPEHTALCWAGCQGAQGPGTHLVVWGSGTGALRSGLGQP